MRQSDINISKVHKKLQLRVHDFKYPYMPPPLVDLLSRIATNGPDGSWLLKVWQ